MGKDFKDNLLHRCTMIIFDGKEGTEKRMSTKSHLWGEGNYGNLNMAALKSNSENS